MESQHCDVFECLQRLVNVLAQDTVDVAMPAFSMKQTVFQNVDLVYRTLTEVCWFWNTDVSEIQKQICNATSGKGVDVEVGLAIRDELCGIIENAQKKKSLSKAVYRF